MARRRQRRHFEATPNLAPMVDVVMVILIFFMLGAGFAPTEPADGRESGAGGGFVLDSQQLTALVEQAVSRVFGHGHAES